MDITDINTLLQVGERISFECKKCENQIPKSVWETYSSFANTVGGIIVLGITEHMEEPDQAKRFEITGVNNPTKLKKEFFDTLNSNKVNRNILIEEDIDIVEYEGHSLLVINIPQVDYRQRPIYINGNMMNGSFKRNYEGDYHCTEDDVKAMILFLWRITRWTTSMLILLQRTAIDSAQLTWIMFGTTIQTRTSC